MWVTFASGYQVVYQALVVILAGLVLYAFLNARRQRLGEAGEPMDFPLEGSHRRDESPQREPQTATATISSTKDRYDVPRRF